MRKWLQRQIAQMVTTLAWLPYRGQPVWIEGGQMVVYPRTTLRRRR